MRKTFNALVTSPDSGEEKKKKSCFQQRHTIQSWVARARTGSYLSLMRAHDDDDNSDDNNDRQSHSIYTLAVQYSSSENETMKDTEKVTHWISSFTFSTASHLLFLFIVSSAVFTLTCKSDHASTYLVKLFQAKATDSCFNSQISG